MRDIGYKIIIKSGHFKLHAQPVKKQRHTGGNGHQKYQTANQDQKTWRPGSQLLGKFFTHLADKHIVARVPINPQNKQNQPGDLGQDKDKHIKPERTWITHLDTFYNIFTFKPLHPLLNDLV